MSRYSNFKQIYPALVFGMICMLLSCKTETCPVSCGGESVDFKVVGFTKAELKGTIVAFYSNGNTYSDTLTDQQLTYGITDTTSDTFNCSGLGISNGASSKVTIYIPSANVTHTLTDFTYSGPLTEQEACHNGGHVAGGAVGIPCNGVPYLVSCKVDGNQVNGGVSAATAGISGLVYIHK